MKKQIKEETIITQLISFGIYTVITLAAPIPTPSDLTHLRDVAPIQKKETVITGSTHSHKVGLTANFL